jgi:P-type E1-E2 ATPase
METVRAAEQNRPRLRRLGDQLGAIYTPVAVTIALIAWIMTGDPVRFLAVLVVATPCPLLIAIPVAIIGAISLCARRAIIVRNAVVLEQVNQCRTAIFDKTGTLTYGEPSLTEMITALVSRRTTFSDSLPASKATPNTTGSRRPPGAEEQGLTLDAASEVHEPPPGPFLGLSSAPRCH